MRIVTGKPRERAGAGSTIAAPERREFAPVDRAAHVAEAAALAAAYRFSPAEWTPSLPACVEQSLGAA